MPEILLNKETFEGLNSRFNSVFAQAIEASESAHKAETARYLGNLFDLNMHQINKEAEDIRFVMHNIVVAFSETDNDLAKKSREVGEQFVGPAFNDSVIEYRKANTAENKSISETVKEYAENGNHVVVNKEDLEQALKEIKKDPKGTMSDVWKFISTSDPEDVKAIFTPDIEKAKNAEKIGKGVETVSKIIVGGDWAKVIGGSTQFIAENYENKGYVSTSFLDNAYCNSFEGMKKDLASGNVIGALQNGRKMLIANYFNTVDPITNKRGRYMFGYCLDDVSDKVGKVNEAIQAVSSDKGFNSFAQTTSTVIRDSLTGFSCFLKYYV